MAITILTYPEGQVCPGDELVVYASGLLTSHVNTLIVTVDGKTIDCIDGLDSSAHVTELNATYQIPNDATSTVKISLKQGVSISKTISLNIISNNSGGSSGSSSSSPTGGYISFKDNDGNELTYLVQGVTPVICETYGWDEGSGSIDSYVFKSPNGSSRVATSNSYATCSFYAPTVTGELIYYVTAYNTHGLSSQVFKKIYCYPYSSPYFLYFRTYRSDSSGVANINGDYITCEYQVNYSSIGGNNNANVNIYCDGILVNANPLSSSGKYITKNPDIDVEHNLYATTFDTYTDQILSATDTVYSSGRILNISADGDSMGIGGMAPSESGKLKCYWDAEFTKNVTVDGTLTVTKGISGVPQVQTSNFTINTIGSGQYTGSITFTKAFENVPCVYMNPNVHDDIIKRVSFFIYKVSETGFQYIVNFSGDTPSDMSYPLKFNWMAISV